MKVTSTIMHFIDGRRVRPGEVFDISDDAKLAPHMTLVEGKAKEPKDATPKGKKSAAPETFSEIAKQDAKDATPKGA